MSIFNIIAAVLGAGALGVYVTAVKKGAPWGTPVMALLVVLAVITVFLPYTVLGDAIERRRHVAARERPWEMLGQELAGDLPEGAKVVVVDVLTGGDMMQKQQRGTEAFREEKTEDVRPHIEALESAAGVGVELVTAVTPEEPGQVGAPDFNAVLRDFEGEGIDLVISQAGLPQYEGRYELEDLECFGWDPAPLFVADVGGSFEAPELRDYMEEGLLSAVMLSHDGEPQVVGSDNVEDLTRMQ